MTRLRACLVTSAAVVGSLLSGFAPGVLPVAAQADANAYFNALVSRADLWKGFSLRPRAGEPVTSPYYANQLEIPRDGGYQHSNAAPKFVTFDARMDAAKVVIPAFAQPGFSATISHNLSSNETRVFPAVWSGAYVVGAQVKLDSEVMMITQADGGAVSPRGFTVDRARYGTSAAPHGAGTALYTANSSLPNQVRLPLDTQDGNTYIFTWDAMYTSSYLGTGLAGNKTFQFTSGGDKIWLEVKTRMDGGSSGTIPPGFDPRVHVGGIDVRSYNRVNGDANWMLTDGDSLGHGFTKNTPIEPITGRFTIHPNRWTRYWVQLQQRANDYDYFDLWVADEAQGPVHLYSRVPISVRPSDFSVRRFWIEFNDSASRLPEGRTTDFRDLVAYVRNFAALRNAGDIKPLLLRPIPGVVPQAGPSPPVNIRVVRS